MLLHSGMAPFVSNSAFMLTRPIVICLTIALPSAPICARSVQAAQRVLSS
jgi:hypothetical protein